MADGVVELNEPTLALIMGHPEAKSTAFGSAGETRILFPVVGIASGYYIWLTRVQLSK
jgi:hypothetical protein